MQSYLNRASEHYCISVFLLWVLFTSGETPSLMSIQILFSTFVSIHSHAISLKIIFLDKISMNHFLRLKFKRFLWFRILLSQLLTPLLAVPFVRLERDPVGTTLAVCSLEPEFESWTPLQRASVMYKPKTLVLGSGSACRDRWVSGPHWPTSPP